VNVVEELSRISLSTIDPGWSKHYAKFLEKLEKCLEEPGSPGMLILLLHSSFDSLAEAFRTFQIFFGKKSQKK
jgi:hypothetical protein